MTGRRDPTPAVHTRGLRVRYGDVLALEDVSVTVDAGRMCGLIGMNGSGKSTLFQALMGIVRLERGHIELFGSPTRQARRDGHVAYVPQAEAVDWNFPIRVRDVAMMGRYGHQGPLRRIRPADRAAVDEALERVGLRDLADRQIGALSGGQRKRAFLARAIAQRARLFLLDEPFAGVDKSSEAMIIALLHTLCDEGHTIVLATHDLAGLPQLCDEAILLQQSVIMHGSPDEALAPATLARAFGVQPAGAGPDAAPASGTPAREAEPSVRRWR